jgi:hypothetical protein
MADRLEERHPELEAAEFEAERPARELSGLPKLVVATGGWLLGPARPPERVLAGLAAPPLLYLEPLTIAVGLGLAVAAVAVHLATRRSGGAPTAAGPREEAVT